MIQMQAQMAISGVRTWCDFCCYCARTGEFNIRRVYFCNAYWSVAEAFLAKLMNCVRLNVVPRYLKRLKGPVPLPTNQGRHGCQVATRYFLAADLARAAHPLAPTLMFVTAVVVEDRLVSKLSTHWGCQVFKGDRGFWFPLDVLVPAEDTTARGTERPPDDGDGDGNRLRDPLSAHGSVSERRHD